MPNKPRRCIVCGKEITNHKYCPKCLGDEAKPEREETDGKETV